MPLKLQLAKNDTVLLGDDTVIRVLTTGRTMQVEIAAPQDLKIRRIPADLSTYQQNIKRVARGEKKGGSPRFDQT